MPTYTRIWKGYLYFFIGKKYILEIIINILLPTTTTDMGDRPNQVPVATHVHVAGEEEDAKVRWWSLSNFHDKVYADKWVGKQAIAQNYTHGLHVRRRRESGRGRGTGTLHCNLFTQIRYYHVKSVGRSVCPSPVWTVSNEVCNNDNTHR